MKAKAARQATALLVSACANSAVIADPVFALFDRIFEAMRDDLAELLLRRLIVKSRKGLLPGVGDALREAACLILEDRDVPVLGVEEAFGQVRPLIQTQGRHRGPGLFKNPSINATIDAIQWSHLCEMRPTPALRAFGRIFAKLEAKRLEQAATDLCPTKPLLARGDKALELESETETMRKPRRRLAAVPMGGMDRSLPAGDR